MSLDTSYIEDLANKVKPMLVWSVFCLINTMYLKKKQAGKKSNFQAYSLMIDHYTKTYIVVLL